MFLSSQISFLKRKKWQVAISGVYGVSQNKEIFFFAKNWCKNYGLWQKLCGVVKLPLTIYDHFKHCYIQRKVPRIFTTLCVFATEWEVNVCKVFSLCLFYFCYDSNNHDTFLVRHRICAIFEFELFIMIKIQIMTCLVR